MYAVEWKMTRDTLKSIADDGCCVYTPSEESFLEEYAPGAITGCPVTDISKPNEKIWVGLQAFDIVVRLDESVQRGWNLDTLAKRKVNQLNPLLASAGVEAIQQSGSTAENLYAIKTRGLELLGKLSPDNGLEYFKRRNESDRFERERAMVAKLFGNVPFAVYGSVLYSENPSDVDAMVFPDEITPETYERITGVFDENSNLPFSFIMLPKEHIRTWVMSDPGNVLSRERSVVANGTVDIPEMDAGWFKQLRMHNIARHYADLREALLPENVDKRMGSLVRMYSILKMPKFVHRDIVSLIDADIPAPIVTRFGSVPKKDAFVEALVTANEQVYWMLMAYLDHLESKLS
jgi:hypothetical protein